MFRPSPARLGMTKLGLTRQGFFYRKGIIVMDQQSVKAVPGYHPLTIRLIDLLKGGVPGDEKTDAQLTETINMDTAVGGKGYGYLASAIRHCEKGCGVVWRRICKENKIRCLNPREILELTHCDIGGIRRRARRGSQRIYGIKQDEIPAVERPQYNAVAAQLGFIASISTNSATKKLEGKTEQPKLADALQLFK